jgi:hypothetical protein
MMETFNKKLTNIIKIKSENNYQFLKKSILNTIKIIKWKKKDFCLKKFKTNAPILSSVTSTSFNPGFAL